MRFACFIILLVTGVMLMPSTTSAQQLTLAANGLSDYAIVLGSKASPSECHAASELKKFLGEISGARLPVVRESTYPEKHRIFIGDSGLLRDLNAGIDFKKLGDEGFAIKTVGEDLVIAGGRLRGTMYGVYAFLEETLGCRWYSSKVSRIPRIKTIAVGRLDITQKPAFEYREPFYRDAFDADWAARNRCNSNAASLDGSRGGKVAFSKFAFVHTFYSLVPPKDFFKDHPEYYSLVNGKRTCDAAQLCLSNPDVLKIATAKVMEWIENDPEATLYSVSQNDCFNPCGCDKCKAIVAEEGSEAGPVIRFVNAIASEVQKKHPGKLIETLAYQYTKEPPKTAPLPNVRIRLCPIENCIAHPFEQCQRSASYVEILKRWSKMTDNLYIWHYNTNFGHYLIPFPNWDELASDVPMYKRNSVKGLFMQGNYSTGGGGEFDELRAYVLAKLLWDPSTDPWKVMDDFLDGYYGKAGRPLRRYIDMLQSKVRGKDIHTGIYTGPESPYFSGEFLTEAGKLFDEAEGAVSDDPATLERVRHARLSIKYVDLMLKYWWKGKNEVNRDEARLFCDECRSRGITNISEGYSVDAFYKAMIKE